MEHNSSVPIFICEREGTEYMEIIGANLNKQKKRPYAFICSIVVAVLVVIGITAGALYMNHKQPATNQINEAQQYQQLKDSFAVQGITYTKEDYNQDKDIINSSIDENGKIVISPEQQKKLSNAYKQSVNKNQQILDLTNSRYLIKDVSTVAQVQDLVVDKVNAMLQFIANDYGWPESKYHGQQHSTAKNYIHQLEQYAMYGTPMDNLFPRVKSLDKQAAELRISAYDEEPYSITNFLSDGREHYLIEWYKAGHPSLGKITSFTLTNKHIKLPGDEYDFSDLQAYISSSYGDFVVYLKPYNAQSDKGSVVSTYRIFDIAVQKK